MSAQKAKAGEKSPFQITAKVVYVPAESRPDQGYYFFAYRISIKNLGTAPSQLMSRHWIITDALGRIEEVRGPGVVGAQPRIQPGQTYEYESACPLPTSSGTMKGRYQMQNDQGETFDVEISEFDLVSPEALH